MRSFPEVRPLLPIDLPLVRRLASQGVMFDSAFALTRGIQTVDVAVQSALSLTDSGTPTFVLRIDDQSYLAQFRHRGHDNQAHLVFIAPGLEAVHETAWLILLDAMTQAAAKRGALALKAELGENDEAFLTLRQTGFAVYTRQTIWKRDPAPIPKNAPPIALGQLRPVTAHDAWGISGLYAGIVPRLVLQADAPPDSAHGGYIYEVKKRIMAYVSVQEGRCGIYIQSLWHPDTYSQVPQLIAALLAKLPRAERLPLYWSVRRYQDWTNSALESFEFAPYHSQALMVKHTVGRIEHPIFRPVQIFDGVMSRTPVIDCFHHEVTIDAAHDEIMMR